MQRYFEWAGGRKTGIGLIGAALGVLMAWALGATFTEWAIYTAGALGFTQATVAYEDSRRANGVPT